MNLDIVAFPHVSFNIDNLLDFVLGSMGVFGKYSHVLPDGSDDEDVRWNDFSHVVSTKRNTLKNK